MPHIANASAALLSRSTSSDARSGLQSVVTFAMNILSLLAAMAPVTAVSAVSWTASPFIPHSVPLAVRSPYLSAWLPQGSGTALNEAWPAFWTGSILGWAGYVTVDGKAYTYLGLPGGVTGSTNAVQKSMSFTATQSTFVLTAGPVDITVTFLSPVEPSDFAKQSMPFSYMAVSAAPNDGALHSVQVYSDISAEWVTGDNSLTANWTTTSANGMVLHQVQLASQSQFNEVSDHIQQGSAYFASTACSATFQSGQDIIVRQQFVTHGNLANTQDTNFRAVSNNWPVFGIAHDLGTISGPSSPAVFVVGHARDPAIEYIVSGGAVQSRSSYFWSQFSSGSAAVLSFLNDYSSALSRAQNFDAKVQSDASKTSSDYAALVALSIRQAFGATEITISKNPDGSFNTDDVLMFMKEISSDGNVNTVDVIFPSWPAWLYTNPSLGKALLLPLFEYQASGQYPNKWSVHDMGSSYPKALGHNDGNDEPMPLEESGNMLIMTLSYTQKTNDLSLIQTYESLLDQWTQFLISDALIPANQISTDDFAGSLANQTNLAIKGIVGIRAMASIESLLGNTAKSQNYSYGNNTSWGLAYNLYADKLLGFNLFPQSIYTMQASWYQTVYTNFGVPLDTRHSYTKSDWQIFTAAMLQSTSTAVRDMFITGVHNYASSANNANREPIGDWYDTTSGVVEGFRARPVVGGHLALLAL
ncbi:hypothetical protein K488DRAFT_81789 [Vararia minispora EC-137]|uniref:Uncharacterized protein n=1 Tax=Vararia minispora EC-137 TaxID=1314806 RepID=A0ACB8QZL0_9AGAM|nr:hypothetical protein K488DRAFT_81789 [Vararia minispora EC-137]